MLFSKPQSIFEQDINAIVGDYDKDFVAILTIVIGKELQPFFIDLYRFLGLQKFLEVLDLSTVYSFKDWPTKEDIETIILLCVVYILKRKKNLSWPEIRATLKKYDFRSIKYSLRLNLLDRYINSVSDALKIKQEEETDVYRLFEEAIEVLSAK